MKLAYKVVLIGSLLVAYVLLINFIALVMIAGGIEEIKPQISSMIVGGNAVEIGVGDSVAVSVTRKRSYGKIIGNGNGEYLYLFNTLKLPHRINGFGFWLIHILSTLAILSLFFLISSEKREEEDEENFYKYPEPYYGYE